MTRRSFYLLNLRRISRDGRGENGKGEERSEEAERKKRGWETRRGVGVADDGDTIHRFRSTASIRIVRPLRLRRFRFTFPRRGRETTSSFLALNGTPDVELRLNAKCVFYRFARPYICGMLRLETLADVLSGHHDFVSMTTRTRMGKKHRRLSEFEIPTFSGRENGGISKRTRLVASIESRISRHRLSC